MKVYHNFFGIDIAKNEFVVAMHGKKCVKSYPNSQQGINAFIASEEDILKESLITMETTGGYEMNLLLSLVHQGYATHRADTVMVKNFVKSMRRFGKTDKIDAQCLAAYAFERQHLLKPFQEVDTNQEQLRILISNRDKLVSAKVQLSNRSQSPLNGPIRDKLERLIDAYQEVIESIEQEAKQLIDSDPLCQAKKQIMMALPGVGETTANKLLASMPELGSMTRRGAANLAGLAPHPYDSGNIKGYRKTRGGRQDVKKSLFMVALSASRSDGRLGEFYRHLLSNGKPKMVALVALMRKITVIINAQIRELIVKKNVHSYPLTGEA